MPLVINDKKRLDKTLDELYVQRKGKRSAPTVKKNPKSNVKTQNATKNFDYTTIAERRRMVSGSNNTGVVNQVYNSRVIKRTHI